MACSCFTLIQGMFKGSKLMPGLEFRAWGLGSSIQGLSLESMFQVLLELGGLRRICLDSTGQLLSSL